MKQRKAGAIASPLAAVLAISLALAGCASNSDQARYELRRESEVGYGVERTVTAYSATGEQVGQWSGTIDVEYCHEPKRVDLVFFDGELAVDRVIISGDAIVVVDND